jgi:hypothetical protein
MSPPLHAWLYPRSIWPHEDSGTRVSLAVGAKAVACLRTCKTCDGKKNSVLVPCWSLNTMLRLSNSWFILWYVSNCTQSIEQLGYGLDDRGVRVRFPAGSRDFLSPIRSRTALGPTQPPIQRVPRAVPPAVTRQERDANGLPISSAEIQKGGNIPPLPTRLHCLVLN